MTERSRTQLVRQLAAEHEKDASVGKALNAAYTGAVRAGTKFLDFSKSLARHPSQFATTIKGRAVDLPESVRTVGVAGGLGLAGVGAAKATLHDAPHKYKELMSELDPSTVQGLGNRGKSIF